MPPKPPAKIEKISRPNISQSSLVVLPDDVLEGFQERIETGIDWIHAAQARRYHKAKCLKDNIPPVPFSDALQNKIKKSILYGFLNENSPISLIDQWEILFPITQWDMDRFANEEEKICFNSANSITTDVEKLIKKSVRAGDRAVLKEELKKVSILRVLDSEMTELDNALADFTELVTLNLCGNYISDIDATFLPPKLEILELQANRISKVDAFAKHLPTSLLYLGLARNLLTSDGVKGLSQLPYGITILDLSENDIYNLDVVLDAVSSLPQLTSLSLAGNPCSVCMGYSAITMMRLPNLRWLDCKEITDEMRPMDIFQPHPDDFRSNYFNFTVLRIMSIPQPPKAEKGATATFHVELELPLLDSKRRNFLMFRRNESLRQLLPPPEDDLMEYKRSSLDPGTSKTFMDHESNSSDSDIYNHLVPKESREILNYTVFESNRVQWNKLVQFQEPTVRIFCPDLVTLKDTFQTVVTVRLVYTLITGKPGKSEKSRKSSLILKQSPGESRLVLATIRCALKLPDWSQPWQNFHWDDSLGTNDATQWVDGDLRTFQYMQAAPKVGKGKPEADTVASKHPFPENLTCHFSFGIDTIVRF